MMEKSSLESLSLADIAQRCAEENERFFKQQGTEFNFCFELFRRAIIDRDPLAWEQVYSQYRGLIERWVERHQLFSATGEEKEFFVNTAFEKLRLYLTPERFNYFSDLRTLLRYFQMIVHNVIIDYLRFAEQVPNEELGVTDFTESEMINEKSRTLWDMIQRYLHSEKERKVFYGSFVLGLKPREIYSESPDLFRDVKEIYRVKENLTERLRSLGNLFDLATQQTVVVSPTDTFLLVGKTQTTEPSLTPDYLAAEINPYLSAIADLQRLIHEIKGLESDEVHIREITQLSPISVSLDGAGDAIEVVRESVVPWRRKHAEQMSQLFLIEKQTEIEIKRAEVLERRARAEKDRREAERLSAEAAHKRAEADRLQLDNIKLRQDLLHAKIKLTLEILDQMAPNLTVQERLEYATNLLGPLTVIVESELDIF